MKKQKATLKLADGREIEIEISEEELKKIEAKKSPYERVAYRSTYYNVVGNLSQVCTSIENRSITDDERYTSINYYNDKKFAEKCIRADLLMRKLRKFAVENNEDFRDNEKWIIYMNPADGKLYTCWVVSSLSPFFSSKKIAEKAKNNFKDELLWYFKECEEIFKGKF